MAVGLILSEVLYLDKLAGNPTYEEDGTHLELEERWENFFNALAETDMLSFAEDLSKGIQDLEGSQVCVGHLALYVDSLHD